MFKLAKSTQLGFAAKSYSASPTNLKFSGNLPPVAFIHRKQSQGNYPYIIRQFLIIAVDRVVRTSIDDKTLTMRGFYS
jgi:hypothetical protein